MKVVPKKVTHTFCPNCGKSVEFKMDWEGVAQNTSKGIITYKELYAFCPECEEEVYVPAINDINTHRRNKAFENKIPFIPEKPVSNLETVIADFLKTSDVEPMRHGEWIPIVSYFHGKPDGRYYCSKCRRVVNKYEEYCPTCGTRMDGDYKKEVGFYREPKNYNISERLADGGKN